ncbi:MAG: Flp pilus assembly complex ATPase component TadA [Christensenellaceae bacterium]|nr:Flp pilus assembly complex ATPase component TadA [Christensenellaceae bacterium]
MQRGVSLGDILLEKGHITKAQLEDAKRWQKTHPNEKISAILLSRGIITEECMLSAMAERFNTTYLNTELVVRRPEILKNVPEQIVKKHCIMPIDIKAGQIIIATHDPHDIGAFEDVKMVSRMDVGFVLAPQRIIESAIDKYYTNAGNFFVSDDATQKVVQTTSAATQQKLSEIESRVDNTPVVKLINSLITQAYMRRASDIHIEPFEEQILVRMRIDGELVECMRLDISTLNSIVSRCKILAGINIAEKRIPQDGRIDFDNGDISIDLRVNTLPTIYGEKVNMRLLATEDAALITLPDLGMPEHLFKQFSRIIKAPNGIILVTGPTGSGKSTTLYAVLSELNKPNVNITTVEDPVEKQIFGVNQVQTNAKAGLTFASGLRAILRQDPDIVMIGEIRDTETAEIAIRAAITGHLVLSTLHTNDAASSIIRLIDMGVASYMVASSVNCVVAQRLVKKLCPECKRRREIRPEEAALLHDDSITHLYEPVGCPRCGNTGFKGRTAIYEIIEIDNDLRRMISEGKNTEEIREFAKEHGATFLEDSIKSLIKDGTTSISEFYRLIYSI